MKNIFRIFTADLKGLLKNFFALVIALGLCVLPALYAWFNIYANWDPYSNTGNIRIAVASLDKGWTNKDGDKLNMGDEIMDELKEKDSIGWVFVDTENEALDGVYSGDYYAAVVIDSDFTYSMYNALADNLANPKITYYENQKKNAVATKITDTAVSTLKSSINEQYIKAVTETVFQATNGISEEMTDSNAVDNFVEKLKAVNSNLQSYSAMLDTFMKGNSMVTEATNDAGDALDKSQEMVGNGIGQLQKGQSGLASTKASFNSYSAEVNASLTQIDASIQTISKDIADAQLGTKAGQLATDIEQVTKDAIELQEQIKKAQENTNTLAGDGSDGSTSETDKLKDVLDKMHDRADSIIAGNAGVDAGSAAGAIGNAAQEAADKQVSSMQKSLENYSKTVNEINNLYQNELVPQMNHLMDNMGETLENVENMLTNLSSTMNSMNDIFGGVDTTLGALNTSLSQLKTVLDNTTAKLSDTLERLEGASESEQMDIIMELLAGDPETYSEFFSEPVAVEANYIYEIKNYGSGVTPFYSVLAIWVGMTILVSILKVHAETEDLGLTNVRPYQMFFGRYLLFLLLSQIQALIIVLGDIYLLDVQCLHPFEFWLTAAVSSLAFSMLIYALTIAFGDIGKAFAVVVMVIQIAGSGGTYPIEALPGFFRAVYIFFPFPYAINAMRECIGGMYQNTYAICLAELMIFAVAGLLIGLVIRIPFMGINHYIEKRMEDTKML